MNKIMLCIFAFAISLSSELFAEVIRAEADALQTHGDKEHLHTRLSWHRVAGVEIHDARPGEIWSVIAELNPRNYGEKIVVISRVLVCAAPCTHPRGYGYGEGEEDIIPASGQYADKNSRYHLVISRATHWRVPEPAHLLYVEL